MFKISGPKGIKLNSFLSNYIGLLKPRYLLWKLHVVNGLEWQQNFTQQNLTFGTFQLFLFFNIFNVFQSNFIRSVQEKNYVFACDGKTFELIRNHDRALLDRIVQVSILLTTLLRKAGPFNVQRRLLVFVKRSSFLYINSSIVCREERSLPECFRSKRFISSNVSKISGNYSIILFHNDVPNFANNSLLVDNDVTFIAGNYHCSIMTSQRLQIIIIIVV